MHAYNIDIDGLDVLKLIYGIRDHGIQPRGRRESKVRTYITSALVFVYYYTKNAI
jgi:hypothetical protein